MAFAHLQKSNGGGGSNEGESSDNSGGRARAVAEGEVNGRNVRFPLGVALGEGAVLAATRSRVPRSGATFAVVGLQAAQVSLIGRYDIGVGLGVEGEALSFVSAWVVDALEGSGAGT